MMLRVVRLVRVFRIIGLILKLGKYSQGARVLALTVAACVRELVILTVCPLKALNPHCPKPKLALDPHGVSPESPKPSLPETQISS